MVELAFRVADYPDHSDPTGSFLEAMQAEGFNPGSIIPDGKFHRFDTAKNGDKAGWYILSDNPPCGTFGDWRDGYQKTWKPGGYSTWSEDQRTLYHNQLDAQKKQAEKERADRYRAAAEQANNLIPTYTAADSQNAYLKSKGVSCAAGLRQRGNDLLVPVINESAEYQSYQIISPDGNKLFLPGGKVTGGYFPVKGDTSTIYVCEGIATGLSIHQATDATVLCAFNCGNLEAVARIAKKLHTDSEIVIAADNDHKTAGNPGVTKGDKAAIAIGGRLVYPITQEGISDFNDLHQTEGIDAVISQLADFKDTKEPRLKLSCASDIRPEPINWVWKEYLALGKLQVLAGPPGTGKTTIALSIAAKISAGKKFPDGSEAVAGNVVIWSGEDDPQDTLVPRLLAMGGNPKNIHFVSDVHTGNKVQSFNPAKHMDLLSAEIKKIGSVSLLIVDPIVNVVTGDSHKNVEVRQSLQPVVDLAACQDIAVIGISHFSKGTAGQNPVERVTGSIAFGALARIVLAAVKIQTSDGEEKRLFTRAKSNIGPDGGGYYYSIRQTELFDYQGLQASRIDWLEPVQGDARALLAEAEVSSDYEERGALSEVQEWLRELLIDEGPMEKKEIMKLARENNFASRTVQRAREKLGVSHQMEGFGKKKMSIWSLPERDDSNRAKQEKQEESENPGMNDRPPENKGFKAGDLFIYAKQHGTANLGTNGTNGEPKKIHEVVI